MQGSIELQDCACCAVQEVSGIENYRFDAKQAVIDMLCGDHCTAYGEEDDLMEYSLEIPNAAYLIFTQASRRKIKNGYGDRIATYIGANGLGAVMWTEPTKNPNTGNYIVLFTWTLDEAAIKVWAKRNKISVED